MDAAARAVDGIVLADSGGNQIRLGELWLSQPVVFNWLRHYG